MYGSPSEAAQDARAWRCLLGGDNASFVLHFQTTVQSFNNIHDCSGVSRPVRTQQQLQGVPAVSDCVVSGNSSPVLEAQDPLQTHSFVHGAIGDFQLLRRYLEAAVEAWQELIQNNVGIIDGGPARKPDLCNKSVLERSRGALHSPLGLR